MLYGFRVDGLRFGLYGFRVQGIRSRVSGFWGPSLRLLGRYLDLLV